MHNQTIARHSLQYLKGTLAASLLIMAQVASAADEIGITPTQRQLTLENTGIVTLRFEVENRSGSTRQLQEQIALPPGWQLITNTTPFYLAGNSRDMRLVHVNLPQGAGAGRYEVAYQVAALDNSSVTSHETISIELEARAGLKLGQHQAPGSLLEGEDFLVDFTVENTGNHTVEYALQADDSEGFIHSIEPRRVNLEPGRSKIVRIRGRVNRQIDETRHYTVTLLARGNGQRSQQSTSIPLIARTPKGIGKYQKLPGKITGRYVHEQRNGSEDEDSTVFQLEYYARGSLDAEGKHNVEVKLRNGDAQNTTGVTSRLEEYYAAYWTDEIKIAAGHQSFATTRLTGNSLSGPGASIEYRPENAEGKQPVKMRGFYAQSRAGDEYDERSVFAELAYQWDDYELGASFLRQRRNDKENDIAAVRGTWRGENITASTELAADKDGYAAAVDVTGQWDQLGVNASVARADQHFDGSITDTLQMYANLHYRFDDSNSISFSTRHTRNNLDREPDREIRTDQEQQIRYTHKLADLDQAEITLGYRQRQEQDERDDSTVDRATKAAIIEYRQRLADFDISASVEKGRRTDRINGDSDGTRYAASINWQPTHDLNIGTSFAVNDHLDNAGKTSQFGVNARYDLSPRSNVRAYAQYNENNFDDSHAYSYELQYNYDFRKYGELGLRARRVDNMASDGTKSEDHIALIEYSLPLDIPLRRRDNIGSLQGHVRYPDNTPASNVVLQMDGQYAVTDEQGKFHYPDVVAREYQLSMDNSRPSAQDYMLDGASKYNIVEVYNGLTSDVELTLQQGAGLQGKLARFIQNTGAELFDENGNNQQPNLHEGDGIGRVMVELKPVGDKGQRTVHRRSTLHDGTFSFRGIQPGQWELSIADNRRIPENFRLEQNSFLVDLTAGDTQELMIRALPMRQTIKRTGPQQGFSVTG